MPSPARSRRGHDLPIAGSDERSADDVASRLKGFTQRELRTVDAYERNRRNRATITDRVAKVLGEQPWAGYDEQSVERHRLAARRGPYGDRAPGQAREREHKDRAGVIRAADERIDRS